MDSTKALDAIKAEIDNLGRRIASSEYVIATLITNAKHGCPPEKLVEWYENEGRAALSAQGEAAPPVRGSFPDSAKWCQPGDIKERHWMVTFDDPDCRHSVFTDEAKARDFWHRSSVSWNCWLWQSAPIAQGEAAQPAAEGWEIDRSTASPILVYEKCSVIQDEQAFYLMRLIQADQAASPAASQDGGGGKHQCIHYPSHRCTCEPGRSLCLKPEDAAIYHGDIDGDSEI